MRALSVKQTLYAVTGLAGAILIAFIVVFQDGIVRFLASPRTPFQVHTPPPPPEYGARGAWLLWPDRTRHDADIFYVHSTTYYSRRRWNSPINDEEADRVRRKIAAPNEIGPFSSIGDIYGPRYREATLYSLFTVKYDGLAARRLAYDDVRRAFKKFLELRDSNRPLILVGYGQGGLHILGLLNEFFNGNDNILRAHLVSAYVIGFPVTQEFLDGLQPALPVCSSATEIRCLVAYLDFEARFNEEMTRARRRQLAWNRHGDLAVYNDGPVVCVNPLSWSTSEEYVDPSGNLGAASATGIAYGMRPPPIPKAVGAQCERGVLVVDTPSRKFLRRGNWFGAKWKALPYNLFYYDLAANASARLASLKDALATEPIWLPPITDEVDLAKSPINTAPE